MPGPRRSGTRCATWGRCTTGSRPASWWVTFANGMTARELIVDVDDTTRRLAWSVVGGPRLTHHNASLQVFAEDDGRSRVVWIADLLPNEVAGYIQAMIEQGMGVMKQTLEK